MDTKILGDLYHLPGACNIGMDDIVKAIIAKKKYHDYKGYCWNVIQGVVTHST